MDLGGRGKFAVVWALLTNVTCVASFVILDAEMKMAATLTLSYLWSLATLSDVLFTMGGRKIAADYVCLVMYGIALIVRWVLETCGLVDGSQYSAVCELVSSIIALLVGRALSDSARRTFNV